MRTSLLNSAYPNYSRYPFTLQTNNFEFWDKICPKRVFLAKTGKVNITIEFYIFELV